MNLKKIKVGDIVEAKVNDRVFYARVTSGIEAKPWGDVVRCEPISHNVSSRTLQNTQVKRLYRERKS